MREFTSLVSEKIGLKVHLREKVKLLCLEIDNNLIDIEGSISKYDNLSISLKVLSESHEKAYKVLLQIETSKRNAKDQEFICKNCHQRFKEYENFNWSCNRHAGNWNGSNYWCCGNSKKDSKGCIISFHQSETLSHNKNTENIVKTCTTCGNKDHTYKECPKDPNCILGTKTNRNPKAEIQRLTLVRKKKEKGKTRKMIYQLRKDEEIGENEFYEISNMKDVLVANGNNYYAIGGQEKDKISEDNDFFPPINSPSNKLLFQKSTPNIYNFNI